MKSITLAQLGIYLILLLLAVFFMLSLLALDTVSNQFPGDYSTLTERDKGLVIMHYVGWGLTSLFSLMGLLLIPGKYKTHNA